MTTSTILPEAVDPARKQLRVLYADDMLQLRELLVIVLSRDGHTVDTAANGFDALEKVTAAPSAYDVIITDHHMPGMNGLELVTSIRQTPYQGKIIIFSSELSEAVNTAYHRLKVHCILPKPIFPSQLRELFARL